MALTTESAARKDATTVSGSPVRLEHRHFAFIAAVLADCKDLANQGTIARRFAEACQRSNPRFDRARFLSACGVQS